MKFKSYGMNCRVVKYISTDVSEVRAASIIKMTSVDIYLTTRRYIPEDSELQYSNNLYHFSFYRFNMFI
jgi:hypothetical protein